MTPPMHTPGHSNGEPRPLQGLLGEKNSLRQKTIETLRETQTATKVRNGTQGVRQPMLPSGALVFRPMLPSLPLDLLLRRLQHLRKSGFEALRDSVAFCSPAQS